MPPKGSGKRKTAAASATSTPADGSVPQTPTLAESLSYLTYPRPFKNPAYTKNATRRTRTLKSVLSQERERERLERERRRVEREAALATATATTTSAGSAATGGNEATVSEDATVPVKDEESMEVDEKPEIETAKATLRALTEEEDIPTYTSIEAPPSILPQRRYCDITGLEAPYTDPATGLRYHDKSIYEFIKTLNTSAVKEYLALRGVNPIVK